MKKQALLIVAGGLMIFASACNNQQSNTPSQGQVDSMVNARVDKMQDDMQAKNDSIINAQAKAQADSIAIATKADSIAKAMNEKNVSKKTTTTTHKASNGKTTTTTTTTTTETPKPGGLKGSSDQNNTNTGGLKSHSDQSQSTKSGGGLRSHSDQSQQPQPSK
jgi:hypothetical protein